MLSSKPVNMYKLHSCATEYGISLTDHPLRQTRKDMIHSFNHIQELFIQHLLFGRCSHWHWGYISEQIFLSLWGLCPSAWHPLDGNPHPTLGTHTPSWSPCHSSLPSHHQPWVLLGPFTLSIHSLRVDVGATEILAQGWGKARSLGIWSVCPQPHSVSEVIGGGGG